MKLVVFCPPGNPGPQDYLFFKDAARRAAAHVSSPENIQLNIFTDGSPASKIKPGGVGLCLSPWMPDQVDHTMKTLGFVVPGVKCSNETEIVALADATLVASAEIKRHIEALTSNKWSLKVNVSSDSLNALRLLESPERQRRLATNRAMRLLGLIQNTLSELKNLPIDITVRFWWIPALSVPQHQFADKKSKCVAVKTGKAPLSQAMKAIFPKPTGLARQAAQLQDPKASADNINEEEENINNGKILEGRNEEHSGRETVKARTYHVGRKGRMGSRALGRQALRSGNPVSGSQQSGAAVTSAKCDPSTEAIQSSESARNLPEDLRPIDLDSLMDDACERYVRYSKYPEFYSKLWDAIESLPRQQRSLMRPALQEQIGVNIYPGWNQSHGLMYSGMFAYYQALYYPNIFSIVEDMALILPEPMQNFVNAAIKQQHKENCVKASDDSTVWVMELQNPRHADILDLHRNIHYATYAAGVPPSGQ